MNIKNIFVLVWIVRSRPISLSSQRCNYITKWRVLKPFLSRLKCILHTFTALCTRYPFFVLIHLSLVSLRCNTSCYVYKFYFSPCQLICIKSQNAKINFTITLKWHVCRTNTFEIIMRYVFSFSKNLLKTNYSIDYY